MDYTMWSVMQEKVYKRRIKDVDDCVNVSWQLGTNRISALFIWKSGIGARVLVRVLQRKADILNTS